MRFPALDRRLFRRSLLFIAPAVLVVPLTRVVSGSELLRLRGPTSPSPVRAELVNVPRRPALAADFSFDSLLGYSGRLRVRLLDREEVNQYPGLVARFGRQVHEPGARSFALPGSKGTADFTFVTLKPWNEKAGSFINTYHVGWWPGERQRMPANYENPVGFIEVTRETAALQLSEHFRVNDFITRDQQSVWPKYVVLREELLDKLELVLTTLEAQGIPTRHVVVLSGFRTPQHNLRASYEGAAYASRHQYGDAADLIIDADRNGRMDDLNRDGVVDFHDTDVINRAVERVERKFPDLVGGLGLYHAMGPSGPFAHIDVRGTRARWTNSAARRTTTAAASGSENTAASSSRATPVGKCVAEGASASLCRTSARQ